MSIERMNNLPKYITSDGNDWDDILCDDSHIIGELRTHNIFHVICLMNAKYIFDNVSDMKDVGVDAIFDMLYEGYDMAELQNASMCYLLNYVLYHKDIGIVVQANDSIDDELVRTILSKDKILDIKFNHIQYKFDGIEEEFAIESNIKYDSGYVMQIVSTSKRIVFNKLFKII